MEKIVRNYLEIKSLIELHEKKSPNNKYTIKKITKSDFQLNKFFYKQIGQNHQWNDRLIWDDKKWINYVSNPDVFAYVLKQKEDIAGFFELIYHKSKSEVEIAYLGLLEEYIEKKLGSFLLAEAIKESFLINAKRVWAHTCTLDHNNALKNYLSRGMKIYYTENLNIKSA